MPKKKLKRRPLKKKPRGRVARERRPVTETELMHGYRFVFDGRCWTIERCKEDADDTWVPMLQYFMTVYAAARWLKRHLAASETEFRADEIDRYIEKLRLAEIVCGQLVEEAAA